MKTLQVYDPALCCSSGVCGVDVDQTLVDFAADLNWLKQQGVAVTRFNLAQQPLAFAQEAAVKAALDAGGAEALPVLLVDGQLRGQGRYPSRAELAQWLALTPETLPVAPAACCSGSRCC
ncbi:arsenite efflux transporter metallochaperone ArsD [Rivihabitans pingtungensis]|jgi:glutaredoxin|uniref:arsenite efflux transporter metallochaperone ArsD n=1 Tax=Rivihabitans pingtungensis TaxID=1054498 RepID=UPI0023EF61A8|nr:arsenite efflux transporter metallochaperone ArsD [Rivihabitans pingtungensis]